jgi:hypothetical protein
MNQVLQPQRRLDSASLTDGKRRACSISAVLLIASSLQPVTRSSNTEQRLPVSSYLVTLYFTVPYLVLSVCSIERYVIERL